MLKKKKMDTFNLLRLVAATGIAISISIVVIFLVSDMPGTAIKSLFLGPFDSKRHFFNVLETSIPLIFTGLATSLIFRSGNFAMSADAALYSGGVVAALAAILLPLPSGVHPVVIILLSGIVGGLVGSIPALLKVYCKTNELVTSLMFNYVFFYLGIFTINRFVVDRSAGTFASLKYAKTAKLPVIVSGTKLHLGFIIVLVVAVLLYLLIHKTSFGYQVTVVGSNLDFAKYSGMKTGFIIVATQMIAGSIAGMGGAVEQLGMYPRFNWQDSPSYAWDGVVVAILSRNNPKNVPLAALFLAYIRVGADLMSRNSDVQNELVSIIQAVIILFITAEQFFASYKQRKESKQALAAQLV